MSLVEHGRLTAHERGDLEALGPTGSYQDYPYRVESAANAAEIATAMPFLDAADRSNGCLEVGSAVFFGPFLVHRSTPNRAANDRRSLLCSYQPGGRRPSHESLARRLAPRERRGA
jgi:ectoine hydroxylase-related dioxygenase (phytanoyl-CoA dioxygenase family)